MNPKIARWIVAAALLVLIAAAAGLVACGGGEGETAAEAPESEQAVLPGAAAWDVSLYFPDGAGRLVAEPRAVSLVQKATAQVGEGGSEGAQIVRGLALVEALLAGPEGEGLLPALPGEVSVENFDVSENGVAYVDLGGAPPQLGTRGEIMAVYSLVNTVALNLSGVESVVLLWNGTQRDTFAGHIDTARSLKPRPQMIRDS